MRSSSTRQLLLVGTCFIITLAFIRVYTSRDEGTGVLFKAREEYGTVRTRLPQPDNLNVPSPTQPPVTVINLEERDAAYESIPCVNASAGPFRFPICTYPAKDDGPSLSILSSKSLSWESGIEAMLKPLEKDEGLQFMDLGVHMGFYTLPAAKKGHKVLAVEANPVTARILRKALVLAKVTDKVTLVQNGLSNKRMKMVLGSNVPNRASTYLLGTEECPKGQKCVQETVNTIFLDDLIPIMRSDRAIMKVDIQGSEIDCFTEATASKFFSKIEVPLMRIEWVMYQNQYASVRSYTKEQVDQWLPFFYKRNYTVHDPNSGALLGADWMKWPFDVAFKKPYRNMGLL